MKKFHRVYPFIIVATVYSREFIALQLISPAPKIEYTTLDVALQEVNSLRLRFISSLSQLLDLLLFESNSELDLHLMLLSHAYLCA
jgi:hypothetical protein